MTPNLRHNPEKPRQKLTMISSSSPSPCAKSGFSKNGAGKVDDMANWGKAATMKALPSLPRNWANWPHSHSLLQCLAQIGAILIFGSTLPPNHPSHLSSPSHLHMQPLPSNSLFNTALGKPLCTLVSPRLLLGGNGIIPRGTGLIPGVFTW